MTDISQIIVRSITKSYIFYLPQTIQPIVEDSDFRSIVPENGYNTIVYYNDLGKSMTSGLEDIILLDILGKQRILKNNLVLLLDAKSSFSNASFHIILEDYKKQIEFHNYATSWMYKNINDVFPNIDDVFISAFKIQANYFDVHYSQLEEHFQFKKEEVNLDSNQVLKNLESTFSKNSPEGISFKLNSAQFGKTKTSTPIPKKKIVVTDEEIDEFLMQSVFGVKL
tara:strand:- start:461 stop:1135 length:675 start_codon:yes stop_codon:yes gene_type:complete